MPGGCGFRAPVGQIVTLSDHGQIDDVIGVGPLADALLDSFVAGSSIITPSLPKRTSRA